MHARLCVGVFLCIFPFVCICVCVSCLVFVCVYVCVYACVCADIIAIGISKVDVNGWIMYVDLGCTP